MEYNDDMRIPLVRVPASPAVKNMTGNESAWIPTKNKIPLASPVDLDVAGLAGMPALPTRSPQSEFVNKLVVIDVPRSIIQSIRTVSNWFDRMIGGWIE